MLFVLSSGFLDVGLSNALLLFRLSLGNAVDEGYGQHWPCGVISFTDGVGKGLFGRESRGCVVPEECFAGAREIKDDVECLG